MSDDNGPDPLEGVSAEALDWHRGALAGDAAVCAAEGFPGYPCIWSRGFHEMHQDVLGRTWQVRSEETVRVARRAPAAVDGMVTVQTVDYGPVTIPEPTWCRGDHREDGYRVDITHLGSETLLKVPTPLGPQVLMTTQLESRPFTTGLPSTGVFMDVELDLGHYPCGPDDLDRMAAGLVETAGRFRKMARLLSTLQAEER